MILELSMNLSNALKNDELRLYYQPKLDLSSGKITGVEALIRWEHPEKGFILPSDFIPLAEQSGLILSFGEWTLRKACEQNKAWQDAGLPPLVMAVNLSPRQLYQRDFVEMVQQILDETRLDPEYLELEITESMMMDVNHALKVINRLKNMGVQISLDDFGTGYSSLYYLKEFPIDKIKIDQSFVRNCTIDEKDATIVKAIIAMGHQLKVEVIAEGVETKDQLVFLQQNLCEQGQGFLFSKPVPPKELEDKFNRLEEIINQKGIPQDLSRQKWLEEALEQARQELRDTVRKQQGMIFKFVEQDGKFIHTLCDGELLYRIGLTPETLIGRELHDVLPAHEADRKLTYYRRAWEGEESVMYVGNLHNIWYLASLRPIRRGGKVVEVIVSCVDVTQVRDIYRKMTETKDKLESLLHNSQDAIEILDLEGNIIQVNPSWERLFGWSEKELIGLWLPNSPKTRKVELSKYVERLYNHESIPPYETIVYKKDGTPIYVSVSLSPIHNADGQIIAVVGSLRDITEKIQAEEALRKSEERYRLITDNIEDLIGFLDVDGIVKYASTSYEKILGISPGELEGNLAFERVHPDDLAHIQKHFMRLVLTTKSCRVEFRYKDAQGKWVDLEAQGTAVLTDNGDVEYIVVVARDITKRKKTEELLLNSEKLSVVGQLAAGFAHEIRNPLTSIQGFVQLLQKGLDKPHFKEILLNEVKRLDDIVNELLTLAKPEKPKIEEVEIKELVDQVIALFYPQAILKNVEVVNEVLSDLPLVNCDSNKIKQVLINLLKNALEATPQNGTIKVQTKRYNSHVIKLKVIDNGCGISEDRLKTIGEPFYSTKEKGTGLGLTICRKIIQEHEGDFTIKSKVNHGTMVEITLPQRYRYTNNIRD